MQQLSMIEFVKQNIQLDIKLEEQAEYSSKNTIEALVATGRGGGLACHQDILYPYYTVTHLPTGKAIVIGISSLEQAQQLIVFIAHFADWTQSTEKEVNSSASRPLELRIMEACHLIGEKFY